MKNLSRFFTVNDLTYVGILQHYFLNNLLRKYTLARQKLSKRPRMKRDRRFTHVPGPCVRSVCLPHFAELMDLSAFDRNGMRKIGELAAEIPTGVTRWRVQGLKATTLPPGNGLVFGDVTWFPAFRNLLDVRCYIWSRMPHVDLHILSALFESIPCPGC